MHRDRNPDFELCGELLDSSTAKCASHKLCESEQRTQRKRREEDGSRKAHEPLESGDEATDAVVPGLP
jgi:hypothetical protein